MVQYTCRFSPKVAALVPSLLLLPSCPRRALSQATTQVWGRSPGWILPPPRVSQLLQPPRHLLRHVQVRLVDRGSLNASTEPGQNLDHLRARLTVPESIIALSFTVTTFGSGFCSRLILIPHPVISNVFSLNSYCHGLIAFRPQTCSSHCRLVPVSASLLLSLVSRLHLLERDLTGTWFTVHWPGEFGLPPDLRPMDHCSRTWWGRPPPRT